MDKTNGAKNGVVRKQNTEDYKLTVISQQTGMMAKKKNNEILEMT